jgi:hypothetical protein
VYLLDIDRAGTANYWLCGTPSPVDFKVQQDSYQSTEWTKAGRTNENEKENFKLTIYDVLWGREIFK